MAIESLHRAVKESIFLKIILGGFMFLAVGGLVLSSVAGSFSGAIGQQTVATIDGEKLSLRNFDSDLNGTLRTAGITTEEAYEAGLVGIFLQGKISNILQMQAAQRLDLVIDDSMVAMQIKEAFGDMGKDEILANLRAQGVSEESLANSIRTNLIYKTIQQMPLSVSSYVPEYMQKADAKLQSERRTGKKYTIPLGHFEKSIAITDADLMTYYQRYLSNYIVAEERAFSIGTLSLNQAAKNLPKITETDIKAEYQARINDFTIPEKRKIAQATVKDPDQAQEIYEYATDNGKLNDAVKSIAGSDKGYRKAADYTQSGLADDLAIIVFDDSIKKGDVTPPVKTALGYTIMMVTDITPSYIQPYKTIRSDLKKTLIEQARYDALYNKIIEAEDLIDAGKNFDEIAKIIGLHVASTKNYSKENVPLAKEKLLKQALENSPAIADELFNLSNGSAAYPLELDDDSFVVVGVKSVKDQITIPFQDVKSDIKKIVMQHQLQSYAQAQAKILVETLNSVSDSDVEIADYPLLVSAKYRSFKNAKRSAKSPLTATIFKTNKGEYGHIIDGKSVTIINVKDVTFTQEKPTNSEEITMIRQVQKGAIDSLLGQYFRDKTTIKINTDLLEHTYGAGSDT